MEIMITKETAEIKAATRFFFESSYAEVNLGIRRLLVTKDFR